MKSYLKTTLVALTLVLGATAPLVRAADSDTTTPAPNAAPETKQHEGKGGKGGDRLARRLAELTDKLSLTADQKTKVEAILKDEQTAIVGLAPEDRRSKGKEIRDSHDAQIRALLTPEQQTKFDALPKMGEHGKKKSE